MAEPRDPDCTLGQVWRACRQSVELKPTSSSGEGGVRWSEGEERQMARACRAGAV